MRTVTKQRLAMRVDIDAEVADGGRRISLRGVLPHLAWHGTYHSGQVALICGLRGIEYQWTFEDRITGSVNDA